MKTRVKEMEDEAEQLRKIQEQVEEKGGSEAVEAAAADETDSRSICVQQVDYSATPEELQEFFAGCGTVNRVTILCGPGGQPKGYAYIEFAEVEAVDAYQPLQLPRSGEQTLGRLLARPRQSG